MSKNLMAFHDRNGFDESADYCINSIKEHLTKYSEMEKTLWTFEERLKLIVEIVDEADYLRRIIERYKDLRIKTLEDMLSEEMPV